ncbi:HigA family addiction module antitoxin [Gloeothece verrucosa]|uniref:Plasmid maintenance system antidote protein, XRE family n=1 Tax=Gloeothece verrucosa (strain PCC 7822) TaxID=497965 RepID=E0UFT6_GLOV7|nr:HigA family addiction module antitoxin [Gloeothece verrucosa]ADN14319.1 plasmid maintenance system antidote protein, XRE family [Gloeothece verrucosa PCC 7822]
MINIPTHRIPTHPGEMLLKEFLEPLAITQEELAEKLYISSEEIKELVKGTQGMKPRLALRLAKFWGMSPEFWLNLQLRWDIYHIEQLEASDLAKIHPYSERV